MGIKLNYNESQFTKSIYEWSSENQEQWESLNSESQRFSSSKMALLPQNEIWVYIERSFLEFMLNFVGDTTCIFEEMFYRLQGTFF